MNVSIITATFNHPSNLHELYLSLKAQEDKDFQWIIVNDGSRQDTEDLIKTFIAEKQLKIEYVYQYNSGKSAAINNGIDIAERYSTDAVLIIDDDELLNINALQIAKYYFQAYKGKCACINFNRSNLNDEPLTKGQPLKDRMMSFQEHKSKKLHADGYVGYYMDFLKGVRFPLFPGEKYVGPSVLMMLASAKSSIMWAGAILGKSDYLEGGITKQGRMLRVKNPIGMIYHASLMMHPDSSIRVKLGYSIYAYAYMKYANLSKADLARFRISMDVFYPTVFIGYLLAKYWRCCLS